MIQNARAAAAAALMLLSIVVPPAPTAVEANPTELPELTASSWVLYEPISGEVVAGFEEHVRRPMASVTKIMTALVANDTLDLDTRVRISTVAPAIGEAEIGLVPGERWFIRDLLYAVLVRSGNDAAVAIAEAAGGSVSGFAEMMNAKAVELGLENSNFVNPHGLDDDNHYTTPFDLAVMARALLEDPDLAEMVRTRIVVFKAAPDGSARTVVNTNALLGRYPDLVGVKTGFTNNAGRVLVSAIEVGDRQLIAVVMNSADHFADSAELLEYGRQLAEYSHRLEGDLPVDAPVDPEDMGRLLVPSVSVLPHGRENVTDLRDTRYGREVEETLRLMLPTVLGGSS